MSTYGGAGSASWHPLGGATEKGKPWSGRRIHFVGVAGAGMSGYARVAHTLGAEVTGSDGAMSPYAQLLAKDGVLQARIGHRAANVPEGKDVEVIYSSAVPTDNQERKIARERGLSERPRAHLLAELTAMKRTIAVAGTHGKTTTSSMLVHALRAAGADPGWLVGAPVGGGLANARWGAGEWLVVEADESDRSMLSLEVEIGVLTNVELDHHATFGSLAELEDAFRAFLAQASTAVIVWDRPELLELAPNSDGKPAVGPSADVVRPSARSARTAADSAGNASHGEVRVIPYDMPAPTLRDGGSRFSWHGREVALDVPGVHNALNATAALQAAALTGADADRAIEGLAGFTGAGRRFQLVGVSARGARVFDDYAHHPTEVTATLHAARTLEQERLVAVFQPHLYSRARLFAREFGAALALADAVVVLDVYPARERAEDHPGVTGLMIAEAVADAAPGRPVYWLPTFVDAEPVLRQMLGAGDVCVMMGAGDVDELARGLVETVEDV